MSVSILVVSDKKPFRDYWTRQIQARGHAVTSIGSLAEFGQGPTGPLYVALLDVRFNDQEWGRIQARIESTRHPIKVQFDDGEEAWWEKLPAEESAKRLEAQVKDLEALLADQESAYALEEHESPARGGLLGKITLKRSYGFHVEEDRFYFSETRLTLAGRMWSRWAAARYKPETFGTQCLRVLFPGGVPAAKAAPKFQWVFSKKFPFLVKSEVTSNGDGEAEKKRKMFLNDLFLGASVPGKAVFFGCSALNDKTARKVSLTELLTENPRFNFIDTPDICSDWFTGKGGEDLFVFLGAAQKKYVQGLLQRFYAGELHPQRVEPEPCAALRGALFLAPTKGSLFEIRILFGKGMLLAVLVRNGFPYSWQFLSSDADKLNENIGAGIRALSTHAQWKLKAPDFPRIVLQGTPALAEKADWVREQFPNAEVLVARSTENDGALTALGAALGALDAETTTINLARFVQKPPGIWTIFPKMEAVVTGAMVLFVLLNLVMQIMKFDRAYRRVKMENSFYSWSMGKNPDALESEKKKLISQMAPLSSFLGNKLLWTPYFVELAKILPPNVQATQWQAEDMFWEKSAHNPRNFSIRLGVQTRPDEKMPEAIDTSLNAFRESELFKKEFPKIQLSNLNWRQSTNGGLILFEVEAFPVANKGGGGGAPAKPQE